MFYKRLYFLHPKFITDCEIVWAKTQLKGKKELFVGTFYMPHRNMKDLNQLEVALHSLNQTKQRHINCPDIKWPNTRSIQIDTNMCRES